MPPIKINSIIAGESNITVSYNTDTVRPGDGISVNRSTPNIIKINNTDQYYNISNNSITNILSSPDPTLILGTFTNYFSHYIDGTTPIILNADVKIKIDDSTVSWKKGQVLRLVFDDEVIPQSFNLSIVTDALNVKV